MPPAVPSLAVQMPGAAIIAGASIAPLEHLTKRFEHCCRGRVRLAGAFRLTSLRGPRHKSSGWGILALSTGRPCASMPARTDEKGGNGHLREHHHCAGARGAWGASLPVAQESEPDLSQRHSDDAGAGVGLCFDFVARQKTHSQTLNLYIVEQLTVITPAGYDRAFGHTTARDLVLRLTYTAHDMEPFSPATWAATAPPSSGTKKSAATCAPASTPSTSTSTAYPTLTPPTSSTPSPSSAATTKPPSATTAPKGRSSPTTAPSPPAIGMWRWRSRLSGLQQLP